MTCELNSPECSGEVKHRNDGHDLCWVHWGAFPKLVPKPVAENPVSKRAEQDARMMIKDEIHKRDGILLGRDRLGRPCPCEFCRLVDELADER